MPTHSKLAKKLVGSSTPSLQDFQNRIASWQAATFPNQSLAGKLAHLCKEAGELRSAPSDLHEWADVLILFLGAAAFQGLTVSELLRLAEEKHAICKNRKWPTSPDADGVYHHLP